MYNIQTMNKIAKVGLGKLDSAKYAVGDNIENPDGILVRSAKLHDMEFGSNLLCIARAGAGTNNIPIDRCTEQGIVVFNTPGANAEAVKELAICALLLAGRDVAGGIEWVKSIAGEGDQVAALVEKGKSQFVGPELKGKALGVIGLGAIGAKIASTATHLGLDVYGYDPYLSVDSAWSLSSHVIHAQTMDEIFAKCDYITLHIPYIPATKHTINAETIAKMKDGVRIINLARGELVNDDDILAALESGKVAKYVTDFPNGKTAGVKNIVAMPHLGASTPESEDNCAVMAALELADYIENGNIKNSVNMPAAVIARTGDPRLCIIHRNIPNVIAKVTEWISAQGINIENMVNASLKGKPNAYTIIDMDKAPENADKVSEIDGVIRVRIIK